MTTRLGFLYPGYSAQDDYPTLARLLDTPIDVRLVHTEMAEDAHRVDALLEIGGPGPLLAGARELAETGGVDACMWACTSGSFVFGWEGALKQVEDISEALGVPASSTSFAFVRAAQALGVTRVAIAATYPEDVAARFADFLHRAGIQTLSVRGRGIITAAEVGTLDRAQMVELVEAGDHPDAEAVLVPDTALHTAEHLDGLDRALGKPVLTANQVTMWEALRLAGSLESRSGLGTLFQLASRH